MKKSIIITIISCVAWMGNSWAQSANDAMLFSQHYSGGTARSAGMSGAFGALGGDLSVLNANPAGLAVFRGTEFTITPAMTFTNTRAEHYGRAFDEKKNTLVFNNIGYVYTLNRYNEKGLQSINFGIAYNRLNDFNSNAYVKRSEAKTSLLDEFVYYAYDDDWNPLPEGQLHPFYERLAFETNAIFKDNNGLYFSDYDDFGYGQTLSRSMKTRGGIGEYSFSFGANINHKLFLGATFGIQDIYYKEYYLHEEVPKEVPNFPIMRSFQFSDEYTVNGWGVNFKAGVIYRPIQMLRFGAAIHTPTHFWMSPYQLTRMDTYWNTSPVDVDKEGAKFDWLPGGIKHYWDDIESDPTEKYRISTPWRYSLSAATVIGNFAIADVDLEIVDFSTSYIRPSDIYDIENEDIVDILKTTVNLKGGAEFRLGPVYLRGGVAFYGNPYNKNEFAADIKDTFKATMSYSGGIGFRNRDFYMDAAYSFMKHPERINNMYLSYNLPDNGYEQATLQTKTGKFILTFGFKF